MGQFYDYKMIDNHFVLDQTHENNASLRSLNFLSVSYRKSLSHDA